MNVIEPSYQIEYVTGTECDDDPVQSPLALIERAARTCYKSEARIAPGTAEKLTRHLIKRGHHAMLEFGLVVVRFIVDRGVSHELVRHRLCSFAQESTRFCNYSGGVTFIRPPWLDQGGSTSASGRWRHAMSRAESDYLALLRGGWTPQQARSVLPNSTKTEIVVGANFREWRTIFGLRVAKAAHPQMRQVMVPLLEEVKTIVPVLFDDVEVPDA